MFGLLAIGGGAYFAWHWQRAVAMRARVRRSAEPYVERYRPPPIICGNEPWTPPPPVYPTGHSFRSVRRDAALERMIFGCECGATLSIHATDWAYDQRNAVERAFWSHAADVEACRL